MVDRYRRALCASFPLQHFLFLMCIQRCYYNDHRPRIGAAVNISEEQQQQQTKMDKYYLDLARAAIVVVRDEGGGIDSRMRIRLEQDCA